MAQGLVRAKKKNDTTVHSAKQKKKAGVTKRGQVAKSSKKNKNERERNSDKLTRVINRNIEKEMIEKAEKERKGVLGVVKPNESGGANLIQYRKELKKKGTKRR